MPYVPEKRYNASKKCNTFKNLGDECGNIAHQNVVVMGRVVEAAHVSVACCNQGGQLFHDSRRVYGVAEAGVHGRLPFGEGAEQLHLVGGHFVEGVGSVEFGVARKVLGLEEELFGALLEGEGGVHALVAVVQCVFPRVQ